VKAAAVSKVLRERHHEILVHTGQHYDYELSGIFFDGLDLPHPHANLGAGSGTHGAQTGAMLEAIETVLLLERPDCTLIYGDTNSTLAGALASSKLHIPVAHVEAGLRSFNRRMPEEINRIVTDSISDILFAPSPSGVANLQREGVAPERIHFAGDVMYDCCLRFGRVAQSESSILADLAIHRRKYVLATIHRSENTDDRETLRGIVRGLECAAARQTVIWPIHPRTRKRMEEFCITADQAELRLIDPCGYLDMIQLEQNALVIVTDSGGVQKEAYFHRVPCVTVRTETEWTELVELGWNTLCDPRSAHDIADEIHRVKDSKGREENVFGEGHAAEKIAAALKAYV
jgi:UDP-GlcNAc3NAcA epimerase